MARASKADPLDALGMALRPSRPAPKPFPVSTSKSDVQAQRFTVNRESARELQSQVRDVLVAAKVDWDESKVTAVARELAEVTRAAHTIQGRMLDAGKALLKIQQTIGPGGYKALAEAKLIPFGEATASKLRRVAEAVNAGRLTIGTMPRAIEAASIVARLERPTIERLLRDGVLRPEATVREIREATRPTPDPETSDGARERLERRLLAIADEIAVLQAEAEEIKRLLAHTRHGKS
jgi:hypothetical protein